VEQQERDDNNSGEREVSSDISRGKRGNRNTVTDLIKT
jgi:hypothetical protein